MYSGLQALTRPANRIGVANQWQATPRSEDFAKNRLALILGESAGNEIASSTYKCSTRRHKEALCIK
jgi:hypothetical protein